MNAPPATVLDASALLAYLFEEPGAAEVERALKGQAVISAVNWAEVVSKFADRGESPDAARKRLIDHGVLGKVLNVVVFDEAQACETARLRQPTRRAGLSLGDRACLALGLSRNLPVMTAERSWRSLDVGVRLITIRWSSPPAPPR